MVSSGSELRAWETAARKVCFGLFVGLAGGLLLAACALTGDADLLEVADVRPHRIEMGDRVTVSGRGFPVGRDASVRFDGIVRKPGASPVTVGTEVSARALAEDRVELDADAALVDALGGGGTYEGSVTVAFATADGQGRVVGRLAHLQLDVEAPARRRLRAEARRVERARRTLAFLGIEPSDERPVTGGLAVAHVTEGGRAEAAGLAAGDVILSIDGARVDVASDVVTVPGVTRATLMAQRTGEVAPVEVDVSLRGLEPVPPVLDLVVDALALLALLGLFAFVAPTARWTSRLDGLLHGSPGAESAAGAVGTGLWRGGFGVVGVLVIALACAAIVSVPFAGRYVPGGLDALAVAVAAATLRRAALWLEVSPLACAPLLARARAVVRVVGVDAVVLVALVGAAVQSGTVRLAGLVATQSGAPWDWLAVRSPAGWALFLLFAGALAASRRRRAPGVAPAPSRTVHALETTHLLALCALGVAAFLGGWQLPAFAQAGAPVAIARVGGALFFAVKTLLLAVAVSRVGPPRPTPLRARMLTSVTAVVLAGALTVAMMLWPLPMVAEKVLGITVCIAVSTLALLALRARHRRERRPTLIVHPFL